MRTNIKTERRTFSLHEISEEEGIILRALLNLSEEGVLKKLNGDKLYWNDSISEEVAVKIGVELCEKIMDMVDTQ
uniref:Uncharacterized protein n=1 Tax=viral metagenome TaxID=1070528 RepID=A0A6H2A4U0_9ZZZZ